MLENNNLKICRVLVRRDFQAHKLRSGLLVTAIALMCALCTFSFALASTVQNGYLYKSQILYGSASHILFFDLTGLQADRLAGHPSVKSSVRVSPIGTLSDDVMEYRSIKLAAVSPGWAETVQAVPTEGRMPQDRSKSGGPANQESIEIALDEMTLDSLGIPHEVGAQFPLRWQPMDGSPERTGIFQLSGWWNSATGFTESYGWIAPEAARQLSSGFSDHVTLGITLFQPKNLDAQAAAILTDSGLGETAFTTNPSYHADHTGFAVSQSMPYLGINLFIVLCGILMIYNIMRISTEQDVRFYGRLKSLGMTPRQIQRFLLEQALLLCLPAVPAGWLLGFGLNLLISPFVVIGMGGNNPAVFFFQLWPFAASGLAACLTTLAACALPARFVGKISPSEALRYLDANASSRKTMRKKSRRVSILCMALDELNRNKGRTALSAASLVVALVLLCGTWTQYISYDEEKYMADMASSDYLLADGSAATPYQRYNPHSQSLTPQLIERLKEHPAVTEAGVIQTVELPMKATAEERAPMIESLSGDDGTGHPRKDAAGNSLQWLEGYERLRETGEYIGVVTGVDGLALEIALGTDEPNAGAFQLDQFYSGKYVVAVGANLMEAITTPPVGSKVTINGREFEIMTSQPARTNLVTGSNSSQAAFHIDYYLPTEVFAEMFPDSGIRNAVINIDHSQQEEFEAFLTGLLKDTGVSVTLRSDYQWNFRNALFHQQMIPFLIGLVLLLIGILNFVSGLVTKMLVRRKEFAVYESLGMTHRQLSRLVLAEGLLCSGLLAALLIPAVSISVWLWSQWWVTHTNTWYITYQFSLLPLWISLLILLIISAAAPLLCLRLLTKESVTERLRVTD